MNRPNDFGRLSVFNEIYEQGYWGVGSGSGSSPDAALPYIQFVENFISTNRITSVVDLGCGDWQFSKYLDFSDAEYIGIDVAESVIQRNNEMFARKSVKFRLFSSYEDVPSADLLLCKDVLQHLSNQEVFKVFKILSRFRFALLTNDIQPWSKAYDALQRLTRKERSSINRDINTGDYRYFDPTKAPFFLDAQNVFEWKIHKLFLRERISPRNLALGIDHRWRKRTYLHKAN